MGATSIQYTNIAQNNVLPAGIEFEWNIPSSEGDTLPKSRYETDKEISFFISPLHEIQEGTPEAEIAAFLENYNGVILFEAINLVTLVAGITVGIGSYRHFEGFTVGSVLCLMSASYSLVSAISNELLRRQLCSPRAINTILAPVQRSHND